MKQFLTTIFCLLAITGTTLAQRIQVGIRGGVSAIDHRFAPVRLGDFTVSRGSPQIGYEVGLVVRLNLARHLHLQSELNYVLADYEFNLLNAGVREISVHANRFEIPVQLGFQFGALRLFGGAIFRVSHSENSRSPQFLKVKFNDDDIAIMGGIGLNIKKFFIDFRVTGYPRQNLWNTFSSYGHQSRVRVTRNITYSGNIGFFF